MKRSVPTVPAFVADAESMVVVGPAHESLTPARRLFLDAVNAVEPRVLKSLREGVLDLYREVLADERRQYLADRERGKLEMYESPRRGDLDAAFRSWGERWHLTDSWVLEAASATCHSWDYELHTKSEARPRWLAGRYAFAWGESRRVPLEVAGWEPGLEERPHAEQRIRASLDQQVTEYLDSVERLAVQRGFRPLPPSRKRTKGQKINRHYLWLAEWQVCGTTQAQIAEESGVYPRAVAAAVAKIAPEIGLTPRSRRKSN